MNEEKLNTLKEKHSISDVHSVSSLNDYLYNKFQSDPTLETIHLLGEVSNLSVTSKNYMYFDMKDKNSKISCVVFKMPLKQRELVENGKEILIHGKVYYYRGQGRAQIMPFNILPVGEGILATKLRTLKEKLKDEGLFDESKKKKIPFLPNKIGIITSKGSDALKDMVNSIHGKFSNMDIYVYHSAVQGDESAHQLCEGIEFFNVIHPVDVIIMGRGGGSLEDLMSFNDESVARAIYGSAIPVITGIGHREDVSIADYTADIHEITPTAAGKVAVPDKLEIISQSEKFKYQVDAAYRKLVKIKDKEKEIKKKQTEIKMKDKEIISHAMVIEQEKKMSIWYKIVILILLMIILGLIGTVIF